MSGKFFLGVYLSSHLYDVVAIATSEDNCSEHDFYSWDEQSDSSFQSLDNVLNWGLNSDLGIFSYMTYDTLTLDVDEVSNSSLIVYPNPANDYLNIKYNTMSYSLEI